MATLQIGKIADKQALADLLWASLLLLGAAFYNGFPLVYSDTGTYLTSGMEGTVPFNRPIAYGLFLRYASLRWSLWLPIILQAFITTYLLRCLLRPYLQPLFRIKFLSLLAVVCALTAVPWYVGQLMPDIFTAWQLLILALVLTRHDLSKSQWLLFGVLFVYSSLSHFSNLFISIGTLLLVVIVRWQQPIVAFSRRNALIVGGWCLLSFFALPLLNWTMEGNFVLGKASNAFLLGRMIDNGVLKTYLDDRCAQRDYRLCHYKDSLPENSRLFH